MSQNGQVTALLAEVRAGRSGALEQLITIVYRELRRIADIHMSRQPVNHTWQPTVLVHEAYLRLLGSGSSDWQDREHFFASAACIMRNLLVDHARTRNRKKRGGGERAVSLEDAPDLAAADPNETLRLDQALHCLAECDPRAARVVELRCFLGLDLEECASALGISERTVKRDWKLAKTWLEAELRNGLDGPL